MNKLIGTSAAILLCLLNNNTSQAGAYIFAGESNGTNLVAHPMGYTGSNSQQLTLDLCIDASSQNKNEMKIPVQNLINTWNRLQETTGNVHQNALGSGKLDIESVLLHEVGHCIGLGHPNFSGSVISGNANNSTVTTRGNNNSFNINAGADDIYGSADDVRGDDINLHWFNLDNNPFIVIEPVDKSSFKLTTSNLPAGDNFVANADRSVSNAMGYQNTEASMQQTTFTRETQRELAADDVSTLLFARTGLDRTVNTADDYTVLLNYNGIVSNASSNSNCDISITIDEPNSLAFCRTGGSFINSSNVRITTAEIHLGTEFNWFFNDEPNGEVVTPPSNVLNFNNFNVGDYGINENNGAGTVNIEDGGASLRLQGNRWQQIAFNYTITTNTVIEFDYSSTSEGEIQGIGFDNNLRRSGHKTFKLFGTQAWGESSFDNYRTSNGVKHYVIPVGQFYTGAAQYLFFANDHDVSNPDSESLFSNIKVYEKAPVSLNFNDFSVGDYGSNQNNGSGSVNIEDGGASLRLQGNRWQQIAYDYTITANTMLEFDYSSSSEGEIQAIGFDNNLRLSGYKAFKLFGTQGWGESDFDNYRISNGVKHYVIPVGQYYTGSMQHLFFVNDHDVSNPDSESLFSNILVYENPQ